MFIVYNNVIEKYGHIKNIRFIYGDSRDSLADIITKLDRSAVFWLDAHWSGGATYGEFDECPLIKEIEILNRSEHENFIFVDDARLFLSPPPSPHSIEQWPDITAVLNVLNSARNKRYIVILEDVIIAVPDFAKLFVGEYCREVNTMSWKEQNRSCLKKVIKNIFSFAR